MYKQGRIDSTGMCVCVYTESNSIQISATYTHNIIMVLVWHDLP